MNTHPKWKYHATEAARIVDTVEEEENLQLGWFDTPAEALQHERARIQREEDDLIAEALRLKNLGGSASGTGAGAGAADDEAAKADAEIYRKELLAQAKEKGLNLHHMTGAEKILAAIAAHDADQSA